MDTVNVKDLFKDVDDLRRFSRQVYFAILQNKNSFTDSDGFMSGRVVDGIMDSSVDEIINKWATASKDRN